MNIVGVPLSMCCKNGFWDCHVFRRYEAEYDSNWGRCATTICTWLRCILVAVLSQASTHPQTSAHNPVLSVLWFFEVLRVTTHRAKLCSQHLLNVTTHPQFLVSELQVAIGTSTGQYCNMVVGTFVNMTRLNFHDHTVNT